MFLLLFVIIIILNFDRLRNIFGNIQTSGAKQNTLLTQVDRDNISSTVTFKCVLYLPKQYLLKLPVTSAFNLRAHTTDS